MTARGARAIVGAGAWVSGGLLAWNLGNYVFFVVAGRLLGPGDYGLVAALLAAVLVAGVPFTALQPALASAGGSEAPPGLYVRALRRGVPATAVGLGAAAIIVLAAGMVSASVPRGPLLASLVVLVPAVVFPLALGQLQARGRFAAYGLSMAALGIPRPVFLLLLWTVGSGLYAPLLGSAATTIAALLLAVALTRTDLGATPAAADSPGWRRFRATVVGGAAGVSATALLTNVDVIAARVFLSAHDAGVFAASAAIAKAVFLVPQAIATVLLPRVAARASTGASTGRVVLAGVVVSLVAAGAVALVTVPVGEAIMRATYGDEFAQAGDLLPAFTMTMGLMGALIVLLYHQMGRGDRRCAVILLAAGVLQIALLAVIHGSTWAIIAVDATVAVLAMVAYELVYRGGGESLIDGLRRSAPPGVPEA